MCNRTAGKFYMYSFIFKQILGYIGLDFFFFLVVVCFHQFFFVD